MLAPACAIGMARCLCTFDTATLARDITGLLRAFFIAYLAGALASVAGHAVRMTLFVATSILCAGLMFINYRFGLDISPKLITLLAETDTAEASGFFRSFFGPAMIAALAGAAALIAAYAFAERSRAESHYIPPISAKFTTLINSLLYLLIATSALLFTVKLREIIQASTAESVEASSVGYHSDTPVKIAHALKAVSQMSYTTGRWTARIRADLADPDIASGNTADTLDIVLVIGESYIRSHSQLYGYPLPTTPFQLAERDAGRLVPFDSVRSVSRFTSGALHSVLSLASDGDGEAACDGTFLPLVFKKAGWDVFMLDNQHVDTEAIWAFTINSFLYNDVAASCYTYASLSTDKSDDIAFIKKEGAAADAVAGSPRRMWIYHLWGQHFPASDFYPHTPGNDCFSSASYAWRDEPWLDNGRRRTIAEYDNATRYNDRALRTILQRHADRPAIAMYFSDHGEEVYDFRDHYARCAPDSKLLADTLMAHRYLDAIYGVPFMIWFSQPYLDKHPGAAMQAAERATMPATTDLAGHTLLNLSGIRTSRYRSDRDMLSPDYIPHRGVTLADLPTAE